MYPPNLQKHKHTHLQFDIVLKNGLRFMTELSESGAQRRHFASSLVGQFTLVWVDLSEQDIQIYEGFIELFFEEFQPVECCHVRHVASCTLKHTRNRQPLRNKGQSDSVTSGIFNFSRKNEKIKTIKKCF